MTSRDALERPDALARDGRGQGARGQPRGAMELPGMEQGLGARAKRSRTAERPGKAPPLAARLPRRFARSQRRSASGHNPSQPSTVGRRGEDHGAPAPPPPPRPRRPWPLWPWGRRAATRSLPPGRLAGSLLPLVLNGRTTDRRCSYRWFLMPFSVLEPRHGGFPRDLSTVVVGSCTATPTDSFSV